MPWLYEHLYKLAKFGFLVSRVFVFMPKPFLTWIAEPSATHPPGTYPYNKTALSSQEYLSGVHSCYHLCVHCREHSPQLPGLSLTRWTWGSLTTSHQALHILNCQQRTQKNQVTAELSQQLIDGISQLPSFTKLSGISYLYPRYQI